MTDLSKSPVRIAGMFDTIARRYDLLNHLLSAGVDRRWRRRAIQALSLTGRERLLDLCTGTADLAIAAVESRPSAAHVVGLDFAHEMLRAGQVKIRRRHQTDRIALVRADATHLPLDDGVVDAVTIGFGIRNVENISAVCAEIRRVLAPGGRIGILEFAIPVTPVVRPLYLWYLNHALPLIGRIISRDPAAYGYLPASIGAFASPHELVTILQQHGFDGVAATRLTFGTVVLYTARRG